MFGSLNRGTGRNRRRRRERPVPAVVVPVSSSNRSLSQGSQGTNGDILFDTASEVGYLITSTLIQALRYVGAIFSRFLALALVVYVLFALISYLTPSIDTLLSPVCSTPIISFVLPICRSRRVSPDYPKLVELQTHLEGVLELSESSSALSLDIRGSETAIRDLTTLLRVSDLVTKDALVDKLEGFVMDAKDAARGLQRLGSRVGGAVDNILAMDEYVLRTLERIHEPTLPSAPSSVSALLGYLIPFSAESQMQRERQALIWSFNAATSQMQEQLRRLVSEAEISLVLLNRLETNTDTLAEMLQRETKGITKDKERLLANLWTFLGGNRLELNALQEDLVLLSSLSAYRKLARDRVVLTISSLIQLSEDLQDLRERVARPALLGVEGDPAGDAVAGGIPLEVHVESIRKGVLRIGEFRKKGIERENEQLRKLLTGPGGGAHTNRLPLGPA